MERKSVTRLAVAAVVAVLSLCAAACADDLLEDAGKQADAEAVPVRFEAECAPLAGTGKTRSMPQPREWKEGDRIQIVATFTGEEMDGADKKPQYGCYRYKEDEDDWIPDNTEDQLLWPVGAEQAKFEAYYIAGLKGRVSANAGPTKFLLGDIEEGCDPLYAENGSVEYGRSVKLDFRHLCTHLELLDVKTDMSRSYWLYSTEEGKDIPNAYQLVYKEDAVDGTAELQFKFTTSKECQTDGGHYYILRNGNDSGSVDFYLAKGNNADDVPGGSDRFIDKDSGTLTDLYGKCRLTYRYDRPYLSFDNVESLNSLNAGTHYEFSIEKQLGIVPDAETDFPDPWEPSEGGDVDIPKLLEGIMNGQDVTDNKGELVLKASGEPYPRLMRDVDFRKFDPIKYIAEGKNPYSGNNTEEDRKAHSGWKLPRLERRFDGNFKTFYNVAYPIFDDINNGEIYNLAIRNSKSEITVGQIEKMTEYAIRGSQTLAMLTEFGLLACSMNGYVGNMLLENTDMTVHVSDELDSEGAQTKRFSIGCLFGNMPSSTSEAVKIEDLELRGDVSVTVTTDDGQLNGVQWCYIGSVAGQMGSLIDGVTMGSDSEGMPGKCTVKADIRSDSPVCMGGLVGRMINRIQKVSLNAVVDGGSTVAMNTYAGGLCGEMVNENTEFGSIDDCSAVVDVTGGTVKWINVNTYSHAYTGGIAAVINSVTCSDVSVSGTVRGGSEGSMTLTSYPYMINYATGGGFGYIASTSSSGAETEISRCSARTSVTQAELRTSGVWGNHTGGFAGLSTIAADKLKAQTNTASASTAFIGQEGTEPSGGVNN